MGRPAARILATVAGTAILAGTAVLAPTPAVAAGAIQLGKVQYDSPGSDGGSNSSLNAEWVRIRNTSSSAKSLAGWTLRDTANHVYRFPSGFKLAAGATVTVHTGSGSNGAAHRYWGEDWYVWNNSGDKAVLKNSAGNVVDTCSWGSGGAGYTSC
jgi:hypothetical protein